jgi:hypothetical protein
MESIERRCRTCRYFEPSPLEGKGWCRCPILFTPTNQHLVDGADLDCRRAFGDYWQPVATEARPVPPDGSQATPRQPLAGVEGSTSGSWLAEPPPLTGATGTPHQTRDGSPTYRSALASSRRGGVRLLRSGRVGP